MGSAADDRRPRATDVVTVPLRSEMVDRANEWRAAIVEKRWEGEPSDSEEPDEPPLTEEVPPIDDAPVPPLTVRTDTVGG